MSTIVTRAGKGSPLTHSEMDANFNNLNSDKLQSPLSANLDIDGNTITSTTGDVKINKTLMDQSHADYSLTIDNQDNSGLGLRIKAGNSDSGTYGSLAVLSVSDKDNNQLFITKASGEVVVYDNLTVNDVYISDSSISTLNTGDDLNVTTNAGTLSLNSINWPAADGTANQTLVTDGSGQLSFTSDLTQSQIAANNFEFPLLDLGRTDTWAGGTQSIDAAKAFVRIQLRSDDPSVTFDYTNFIDSTNNRNKQTIMIDYRSGNGNISWPTSLVWENSITPNFASSSNSRWMITVNQASGGQDAQVTHVWRSAGASNYSKLFNENLSNLRDVDDASPTDGQVLAWDNANSYWKPAAATGFTGDLAGDDLTDSSQDITIKPTGSTQAELRMLDTGNDSMKLQLVGVNTDAVGGQIDAVDQLGARANMSFTAKQTDFDSNGGSIRFKTNATSETIRFLPAQGAASANDIEISSDGLGSMSVISNGNVSFGTANAQVSMPGGTHRIQLNKLVEMPLYTTTERNALGTVTQGSVLFNTTTDKLQVYANSAWVDLH